MRNPVLSVLIFLLAGAAWGGEPVARQELLGKTFASKSSPCTVTIRTDETWTAKCGLLEDKYAVETLSGEGIRLVNCYGEPSCQGVEFLGHGFRRPLQAFLVQDPALSPNVILGLVYGSPADGMVEMLFAD